MKPQLIGWKKSQETRKVERYLKERRIDFQFVDPGVRALAPRELDAIAHAVGGYDQLIETASKSYRKRGMAYMEYDPREELLEDPELLRVPIVRCNTGTAVCPDTEMLDTLFPR